VARTHLQLRLAQLAREHGMSYSAARVARQRSRWGSCSSRGTISLNRNLMFLEPHLVDSLLLHELAHTQVLNHSPRFWRRLVELDPDAHEHRAAMREAGRLVPAWADA
jgi:predicted metal-dependent hydrolase